MVLNRKLRVGFLLESSDVEAWAAEAIRRVCLSPIAEAALLVVGEWRRPDEKDARQNFMKRLLSKVYQYFENKRFPLKPNAFVRVHVASLSCDVPVLRLASLDQNELNTMRSHHLDVLVTFSPSCVRREIAQCARLGVWSYVHGTGKARDCVPPGFREVIERHPTTVARIAVLAGESSGDGTILYESHSPTHIRSANRNRNRCYWKSSAFLERVLRRFHRSGELPSTGSQLLPQLSFSNHPPMTAVSLIVSLFDHFFRRVRLKIQGIFFLEQWMLMFKTEPLSRSFPQFTPIIPPKNRIWADPFVVWKDGRYFIFVEESLITPKKGFLSVIEMNERGEYQQPVKVLERPYHLSYPFIFEYDGSCYMIPETSQNRTIELYKCAEFPHRWEFQRNLMENTVAVDTTLTCHGGLWWMFTNGCEHEGTSTWDELFLYHAETPLSSSWIPHPENPVVSDVRKARPAGRIYEREGTLYRPSQNCTPRYGFGLKLNRIITLTTDHYQEVEEESVEPTWMRGLRGVHTYNSERQLTVIDAILRRSRFLG